MLKKTVSYTDFNGVQHTEDFYFHLSKAELTNNELSEDSISALLRSMVGTPENPKNPEDIEPAAVINILEKILIMGYGIKSEDGMFFRRLKNPEDFKYHPAYDEIFMELMSDPDKYSAFIKGILPADVEAEAEKRLSEGTVKSGNA